MVLSANPSSLPKYSANPGTADSNGNARRRRLRITGSLQASCGICRTPHSASIACLRIATTVFTLAPCCSSHRDTNSFILAFHSNVSATLLLCELGKVKKAAAGGDRQRGESTRVLRAIPSSSLFVEPANYHGFCRWLRA